MQEALRRLTAAAAAESNGATLENNLLAHAVDAARAMATVGEISEAIEKVYGRHSGQIRTIQGVYREEAHNAEAARQAMDEVAAKVAEFRHVEERLGAGIERDKRNLKIDALRAEEREIERLQHGALDAGSMHRSTLNTRLDALRHDVDALYEKSFDYEPIDLDAAALAFASRYGSRAA